MTELNKRLIEDVLPLQELNKYAQKGGGIGSLNAMHPYFARRPLTASRAMTLAALVDAPKTEAERQKIEQLLVRLSSEEWPDMPELLEQAQLLIRAAHDGRAPRVLDPFAGGGSMPFEAMRLGCEATALDLNPVAYLALLATLVYPQKFGTNATSKIGADENRNLFEQARITLHGSSLVEDVKYWSEWVLAQTEAEIGSCYPIDPDGALPVAYLWAKTVRCHHCGGEVPLIRTRWLQKGSNREPVAYRLKVDKVAKNYEVTVIKGEAAFQDDPDVGTMRGATVQCLYCLTPIERERITEQGKTGQMGSHLLIVILKRGEIRGRDFRPARPADREAFDQAAELLANAEMEGYDFWGFERLLSVLPEEPTPPSRARSVSIRLYGVEEWRHMFNDRQIISILTLGKWIREVRGIVAEKDETYAKAIALYLSIVISRYISRNCVMCVWDPSRNTISSLFARKDIAMTWDYAESNPLSGEAGSWQSQTDALCYSISNVISSRTQAGTVRLGSATQLPDDWTGQYDAVICDPPYYDSITYADLSDYFYPWHKRVIGDDYPLAFITEVTPKSEELVQEAVYHGGTNKKARVFYEDGMANAFSEMHRVLKKDGISVIMFAHKKSSAWETLVGALIRAGFQVTASWPLNTEGRRLQSYRAVALASSVYLVCRKRRNGGKGYLEDIEVELRQNIRHYLERFWAAGIGGADFFMSAIGPGLAVFSRFARVERYDGSQVTVSDFLDLVRHEVASYALERIIGEQGYEERLDAPTQFYLLWRWGYGDWDVPDGEAILLSQAVGIDLNSLQNREALVKKVKGKFRLLSPDARVSRLSKVPERVITGGAVSLVDVIHKSCLLWRNENDEDLSKLIAARGGEMWPVAQAVAELLPKGNFERKALEGMLGTRFDLESRAEHWVQTNKYKAQEKPIQLPLWKEEEG